MIQLAGLAANTSDPVGRGALFRFLTGDIYQTLRNAYPAVKNYTLWSACGNYKNGIYIQIELPLKMCENGECQLNFRMTPLVWHSVQKNNCN